MKTSNVAVLVGSLRRGSYSRLLAKALIAAAPAALKLSFVEIGDLPMYNQDLDENAPPTQWLAFRDTIRASQAVLFVTPEYNRSIPAVLKNAIDVGSRPHGKGAWNGKPGAIVSCTPGALGAFGANHHLRQTLVFVNVLAMAQPEAYIGGVDKLVTADGKASNPNTAEFLAKYMAAFAAWIEQVISLKC